jgi:hypothetical protein
MNGFRFALVALMIIVCPIALRGEKLSREELKAFGSIRPMDPYEYCRKIASPEFAGRLTGDEGYTDAAKWAASKFKEWGLRPIDGKKGYLQAFPSPYTIVDEAEMTLLLRGAGGVAAAAPPRELKLKAPSDFLPLLFAASGEATAGLVFAGWGISAPSLGYDDYAGLDAAGKFVLCFRGTPDRENEAFEKYDEHRTRMKTAHEKGAVGVIYIYEKPDAHPNGDWIEGFLPAMIGEPVADSLFAERGLACAGIKDGLVKSKQPASFALESRVRYRVKSRHFQDGVGYNIAGYVEGSDPELKNECLVIGAHFDHCGSHMGFVFPGADDNASGSAVVMEIAEAYAALDVKPRRSVVFALFGGEEQGLAGSIYFAGHLPSPFEKVVGMFNYDMDGEGDGTSCGYTSEPPELLATLEDADSHVRTLRNKWPIKHVGVRSSDFAPFFLKGAPCVACFSNGPHVAYHETGDTIYRINPDILADVARLGFLASYRWANR